jgi:hypothetical protein
MLFRPKSMAFGSGDDGTSTGGAAMRPRAFLWDCGTSWRPGATASALWQNAPCGGNPARALIYTFGAALEAVALSGVGEVSFSFGSPDQ